MTKTEIYNSDYTKLNHAYIQIYETFQKLSEAPDADGEVAMVLAGILRAFNPTLDKIKSEMTVKTRFKNEAPAQKKPEVVREVTENGGVILHPKFV